MVPAPSHELKYRILGSLLFLPILILFGSGGMLTMLGGGLLSAGISYEFSTLVSRKDGGQRHIIGSLAFTSYLLGMIPFIVEGISMLWGSWIACDCLSSCLYYHQAIWLYSLFSDGLSL